MKLEVEVSDQQIHDVALLAQQSGNTPETYIQNMITSALDERIQYERWAMNKVQESFDRTDSGAAIVTSNDQVFAALERRIADKLGTARR